MASAALAEKRTVSASSTESAGGDRVTALTTCSTATDAVPEAAPAAAVTVARPFPAAATRPTPSTTVTEVSLLDQETGTFAIVSPYWSTTLAENRAVSPSAESSAEDGTTNSSVGAGGSTPSSHP